MPFTGRLRSSVKRPVTATWKDIEIEGNQPVRDLWLQKDLEPADGSVTAEIPGRGAVLLKIGKPKQ